MHALLNKKKLKNLTFFMLLPPKVLQNASKVGQSQESNCDIQQVHCIFVCIDGFQYE